MSLWIWILSLAGYPVVGLVSTVANWESSSASIALRAVVLAMSFVVAILTKKVLVHLRGNGWLYLFWGFYACRLAWDAVAVGVPGAGQALFVFMFLCVIPALAVGMGVGAQFSERGAAWRLGVLGSLVCLLALLMQTLGWGVSRTLDAEFTGGRLSFVAVNPITLAHTGCTVLICVMCLARHRTSAFEKLMIALMATLGFWCLLAAGSRGPLVALVMCVLLVSLRARRPIIALAVGAVLVAVVFYEGSNLLERIGKAAGEDKSSQERLLLLANAIQQFAENPIFGSAYAERVSGEYPHNIFVESAMAMGVPGLILIVAIIVGAVRNVWRQLSTGVVLVPLVCVQYIVAAQFSGSLWAAAALYITLVLSSRLAVQGFRDGPEVVAGSQIQRVVRNGG